MNVGDAATFEVDLDSALSSAYDKATTPEPNEESPKETPESEPGHKPDNVETPIDKIDTGSQEPEKPADNTQPLSPHPRWSTEEKAAFAALPREAQAFVLKRESDVEKNLTQKTQEIAEQRKNYEGLESVLAPRRQAMARQGGEAQVINQLLQLSDFANNDPAGFIQWWAKDRNIDLSSFVPKPAEGEYVDPALHAAQKRIESVEQRIAQREQQEQQARTQATQSEIDKFSSEADSTGKPIRPYFNEVRNEMSALFKANLVNTLDDAYQRAIYANPGIRQKLFDEQKKADEASRLNATKEAAAKASKAAGVQVKTKTPATSGKAKGTWEDTVDDAVNAAFGA